MHPETIKMRMVRALTVVVALVLAWAGTASAQVTFQPTGCDFRVWFVKEPTITTMTIPVARGESVETIVAELNVRLNDGFAHYFRAECTEVALGTISRGDLIEDMTELASMNGLQNPTIWVEEPSSGQVVGRVRASLDIGQRVYLLDIRRYIGDSSLLDVWAGAERFPTEGIIMFFRSVAYRGRLLHN